MMSWICNCGCIGFEIELDYNVEYFKFVDLAESLGHTYEECEPTT